VTTKVTITSEGRWERKIFASQDAVKVTTTETCRFKILEWSGNGVTLERQYCDTVVTAWGRGATAFPPTRRTGRTSVPRSLPSHCLLDRELSTRFAHCSHTRSAGVRPDPLVPGPAAGAKCRNLVGLGVWLAVSDDVRTWVMANAA